MSGILARAVAQTVVFIVNVVGKSFVQAYQKAQAGGGQAGSAARSAVAGARMPVDQARQILNLEKTFTREEVAQMFEKHYAANDPDKGGSFYVQSKVFQARETLMAELKRQAEAKAEGSGAGGQQQKSQEMQ